MLAAQLTAMHINIRCEATCRNIRNDDTSHGEASTDWISKRLSLSFEAPSSPPGRAAPGLLYKRKGRGSASAPEWQSGSIYVITNRKDAR